KLIVVILRLSEVINNISEVIKEGSSIRGIGRPAVARHLVSHANLVSVLSFVRSTSVASGVEDDFSGGLDSFCDLWTVRTERQFEFIEFVRWKARYIESNNLRL